MEDQIVVQTKLGKLRGRVRNSAFSKKTYYSFQGIPFGKPPTGELRFKTPLPFGGWEGVRDALEDGPICVQPEMYTQFDQIDPSQPKMSSVGDEDCLYLNVYTNEHPEEVECKRPVMVSIHGGGFMGGSGSFQGNAPEYLVEGDVVLVFINYRNGPLGFLSLDTEEVPGNAGLKDQVLALKWVRDNIDSFGGDPDNITIFGISAGGASVHYHLLSPLSKDLFHKAIVQSGYGQNMWAFQQSPKKVALKLAKKLGCTSEDPGEILTFLQAASKDKIMDASLEICREKEMNNLMCCSFVFSPSVEVAGSEKFLPDTPSNLLRLGEYNKVPTILGMGQNEGTLQEMYLFMSGQSGEELISTLNENPAILVPHFLGLKSGSREEKEVQKAIWDFYMEGKPLSLDNFNKYVDLHSDLQFNIGFGETRKVLVKTSTCPTYSYYFTNHSRCFCKAGNAVNQNSFNYRRNEETCHGADCFFLYSSVCWIKAPEVTTEDRKAILKHVQTWAKFASTGDPNTEESGVKWSRDSQSSPCYMDFGPTWTMREGIPFAERINFWLQLIENYCEVKDSVVISTKLGKLRGRIRQNSFTRRKYFSFQGIPFAKPPVGDLRFKAPQPFGGWKGVRDALDDGPGGKSPVLFPKTLDGKDRHDISEGDEDCLYLNIYINKLPNNANSKKPVMTSIHGGGFLGGSGNFSAFCPEYLLEEDVVLVFFTYRCNVYGFLSLDTEEVPGNAGLKDQVLALKWVRNNIDSFGGDPDNVTIFGISAGATSVHYQLLSPLSKGLFHKAIVQSGFAQNLWGFQPSPKKMALKLARNLGCTSEDCGEILEYMQSASSDDLIVAHNRIATEKENVMCCGLVFSPSVEVVGSEKFLPDTPNNLMKSGNFNKVPTIIGICQNEGVLQQLFFILSGLKIEDIYPTINDNPEYLVPHFLGLAHGSLEEKEAQHAIWDFYFKGKPLSWENLRAYIDLHSDLQFNLGFAETRRYLVTNSSCPTYSYLFTDHSNCPCQAFKKMLPEDHQQDSVTRDDETCHGADVLLFYRVQSNFNVEMSLEYKKNISKYIKTWAKFATSGNPNNDAIGIEWEKDSDKRPCHMDMGIKWFMREGVPFSERMDFWHHLTEKYSSQ